MGAVEENPLESVECRPSYLGPRVHPKRGRSVGHLPESCSLGAALGERKGAIDEVASQGGVNIPTRLGDEWVCVEALRAEWWWRRR